MIAWNSASSSENDVSIRHAISGWSSGSRGTPRRRCRREGARRGSRRRGGSAGIRRSASLGGVGLADDLHVVLGVEELAHAAAHDLVVVEQEDPDRVQIMVTAAAYRRREENPVTRRVHADAGTQQELAPRDESLGSSWLAPRR